MKRRLLAILSALGLGAVLALGSVAPAQAFSQITYTANCPETAYQQQLVIQYQNSGSSVNITANGTSRSVPNGTTIYYFPPQPYDTVAYVMTGSGSLNWYYHVYCYYRE